jgi:hypothetical protein
VSNLPADAGARKAIPICTGVLDYFPDALAEVAKVSKAGNDQHNPGEPLHWAKEKSIGNGDEIMRHLVDRGTLDSDGQRHSAKLCWRALELLQRELDADCEAMAAHLRTPALDRLDEIASASQVDMIFAGQVLDLGSPDVLALLDQVNAILDELPWVPNRKKRKPKKRLDKRRKR